MDNYNIELSDEVIDWLMDNRSVSFRTIDDLIKHLITFYEQRVGPENDSAELRYWSD